ncbi:MAG: DMT family transporter [Gammaproteobacteria bacterium]|nr:DMT family transporter [Gammaproteobacteria bacterium]
MSNSRRIGFLPYLLLIVPPLMWGGNFVVGRYIHDAIPPATMNFWRWLIALLILLLWSGKNVWHRRDVIRKHWWFLFLLGLSGITLFHTFVYASLHFTTAVNSTLIFTLTPVTIIILSWVLFRDTITSRQILGIVISLIGAAAIILKGDWRLLLDISFNRGDLLMLCAMPNWAFYSVMLKRRPMELDANLLLISTISIGLALQVPLFLWEFLQEQTMVINTASILSIGYVCIGPSIIAYFCWNRGVAEVGANQAGVFLHLVPVFGAIFAILFLNEQMYRYHFIGIVLIAAGIYLSTYAGRLRLRTQSAE